jgi:hypothetical protein
MNKIVHPDGFVWSNYPFGVHDWAFMYEYILSNGVKTVLEVGSGLSSLLISQLCHVDTIENNEIWGNKVVAAITDIHDLHVYRWDGVNWPDFSGKRYDFVFIDGPDEGDMEKRRELRWDGIPREVSFRCAPPLTDVVMAHDCFRVAEMTWQLVYLAPKFIMTNLIKSDDEPERAGRAMAVWKRVGT